MVDANYEEIRKLRQSLIAANQMIVAIAARLEKAGISDSLIHEMSGSALAILDSDVRLQFEQDFRRLDGYKGA